MRPEPRVFKALGSSPRLTILNELADGPRTSSDLRRALGDMAPSAVSRHTAVLLDAGLVTMRPVGSFRLFSLDPRGLVEAFTALQTLAVWADRASRVAA